MSTEGHIVTNHHIISECTEIKLTGLDQKVTVVTSDVSNDLALLKTTPTHQAATLSANDTLKLGQEIAVFGYPLNSVLSSSGNFTLGSISALSGIANNTNHVQFSAPVQPGSSGSPLIDRKGDVVGVVSIKLNDNKFVEATGQIAQSVNFAINHQTLKAFLTLNNVPYTSRHALFNFDKSNEVIANEAKQWTVIIGCWQ